MRVVRFLRMLSLVAKAIPSYKKTIIIIVLILSSLGLYQYQVSKNDLISEAEGFKTVLGVLSVVPLDDLSNTLALSGKKFTTINDAVLQIEDLYHLKDADVAFISTDAGGKMTKQYYLLVLQKGHKPYFSKSISSPSGADIDTPIIKGNSVIVDSGQYNGIRNITTYSNGKITYKKIREKEVTQAKEESCQLLYDSVYMDPEVTMPPKCSDSPLIAGGHTSYDYWSVVSDDGIKVTAFESISKETCISKTILEYSEFKLKVCNGK